ncbi:hypothetical protein UFOVP1636_247 [uncultured Caudovirales phage]|jgi:hypothetical protein|uniref:Uncharacterized protein n=1 Tax=uncultured Caudovirales phage TaxID=2100421 RepID=A0A6J5T2X4_9CAUD|nr:hypothetical protein UFOVP1636_247 [uncultured Caudovirales phage]
MSIEIDTLSEVYTILKQYIPVKDRQEAADNLMGLLVDMLDDLELKELSGVDSVLSRAYKEYAGESDEEEIDLGYED